jgi:uncharacterized protein with HEPN domain
MEGDQLGRLRDILEAARLIAAYVKGVTEAESRADTEKQDAVIRRIEIIGEATAHLIQGTRQAVRELPFSKNARNAQHCGSRLRQRGRRHRLGGRDRPPARGVRGTGRILR